MEEKAQGKVIRNSETGEGICTARNKVWQESRMGTRRQLDKSSTGRRSDLVQNNLGSKRMDNVLSTENKIS